MNKEIIKNIKREFYVYRNGMLGDRLRNAGDKHKIIFGLNLPQIISISQNIEKSKEIAIELWNNTSTRESQLLAPMLFPLELLDIEDARLMITTVPNNEVADVLCHRLLRHAPFAQELYSEYVDSINDMERYTALRIAMNLLAMNIFNNIDDLKNRAQHEIKKNCETTYRFALSIIDEIEYRQDSNL